MRRMMKRIATLVAVALIGAMLGGCTKCGWIWDDLTTTPKSCRNDAPVN